MQSDKSVLVADPVPGGPVPLGPGPHLFIRAIGVDGAPLEGFDWADCTPLRGDSVAHPVTWTADPVRLEFRLRHGELYGFDVVCR